MFGVAQFNCNQSSNGKVFRMNDKHFHFDKKKLFLKIVFKYTKIQLIQIFDKKKKLLMLKTFSDV